MRCPLLLYANIIKKSIDLNKKIKGEQKMKTQTQKLQEIVRREQALQKLGLSKKKTTIIKGVR